MSLSRLAKLTMALTFALGLGGQAAAEAGFSDWMRGCLVFTGASVGGVVVGASSSGLSVSNPSSLAASAVLGCLIGGYMGADVVDQAEAKVEGELMLKNTRLKNSIYGVMHDLCVIKDECGADGVSSYSDYEKTLLAPKGKKLNSNKLIRPKTGN